MTTATTAVPTAISVSGLVSWPPTLEELFLRRYDRRQAHAGAAAGDGQGQRTRPRAGR
jgi:hypothetical protein